jgi:hypothetical protein
VIANPHARDAVAHRLDDARSFVARHDREGMPRRPGHQVPVAVTQLFSLRENAIAKEPGLS